MNCKFCKKKIETNRIFMINKQNFCSEKCFKETMDSKNNLPEAVKRFNFLRL